MKQSVVLSCGHPGMAEHTRGDRLVRCLFCGNEDVIHAVTVTVTTYELNPTTPSTLFDEATNAE